MKIEFAFDLKCVYVCMFISTFLFCKFSRKWDLQIYESISPVFRIDLGWKHSFISMVYRRTSSNQYLIRKFERFKSHRKLIIIIIPLRWWDTISRLHWMIEFQVWNAFQWNRKNGISPSFHRPCNPRCNRCLLSMYYRNEKSEMR